MASLTSADITLEAIREEDRRVLELQKKANELKAAFEAAEKVAAAAAQSLEWRRILRRIEDDSVLRSTVCSLRQTIQQFQNSFHEPEGYNKDGESAEYSATDDYADFSVVDQALDSIIDCCHEQLDSNNIERAAMMLLIVSNEIGRLLETITDMKSSGVVGVPAAEVEEARDSIVSEWQRLFFDADNGSVEVGTGVLTRDDATRWYQLVAHHLGAPFDSVPSSS